MLTMALALAIGASAPAMQSHTYAIDNSNFANPERGFWLSDRDLGPLRSAGMTMAHAYVRLDAFRDRPLSGEFLEQLQARFDAARAAGVKLVPRFTYNFPKGLPLAPGDEDAPAFGGVPVSYWLDLKDYDPAAAAKKLGIPMLILQGERDFQVPMADFALWKAAVGNSKGVVMKSYPALNHLFVAGEGKSLPAEYSRPGHVAPAVIEEIAKFVK